MLAASGQPDHRLISEWNHLVFSFKESFWRHGGQGQGRAGRTRRPKMLRRITLLSVLMGFDLFARKADSFSISFTQKLNVPGRLLDFPLSSSHRSSVIGPIMQLSAKKAQKGDKKPKKAASSTPTAEKAANKQTSKVGNCFRRWDFLSYVHCGRS